VRNFCLLPGALAALSLMFRCCLFAAFLAVPAFGVNESNSLPPSFACEVRYHFREHLGATKSGEKRVSAPSYEREALPVARVVNTVSPTTQVVEGRVAHLPYHFLVKVAQCNGSETGTLEVNIADNSGKSLAGFPRVIPNPLTKTGDTSRNEFEIPIDQSLKKKIEKALLAKGQFLTHVDLIIGMDEDFLSADFPK
jgi:hypothetical protein